MSTVLNRKFFTLSAQNGVFLGAVASCFMIVFSGFIVLFNHMPTVMRYLSNISLLKYCLEALVAAIYERGRTDFKCPEEIMYCHYNKSETILKELGMDSESFFMNVGKILFQLFLFKGLSYITLRKRLLKG